MEAIVQWALIVVVIIFVILSLILWLAKEHTERHAKALEESTQKYVKLLSRGSISDSVSQVQNLVDLDRNGLILAFSVLVERKDIEIDRLIAIVSTSDVIPYYIKKSKSRYPYVRMHAYLQLNRLSLPGLRDFFFESAEKEISINNDGKLAAACLLSAANLSSNNGDITRIVLFLQKSAKQSGGFQEGIIIQSGEAIRNKIGVDSLDLELTNLMHNIDVRDQIYTSLILAIGKLRLLNLIGIINEAYEIACDRQISIIKIACLRAVGEMNSDLNCASFLYLGFEDEDWRVRATASSTVGLLKMTSATVSLVKLLSDPAYYVRLNSARSLLQMGANSVLEQIVNVADVDKNTIDPFSTSICRYALNEVRHYA